MSSALERALDLTVLSMDLFQEALDCTRQAGDFSFIAGVLRTIGHCLFIQGEFEPARTYFEDSLALGDPGQHESEAWFASALMGLSNLHFELGDYATARALLDQALRYSPASDDVTYRASSRCCRRATSPEPNTTGVPPSPISKKRYAQPSRAGDVIRCLEAIAASLDDNGEPREAVVMLGSADKARRDLG